MLPPLATEILAIIGAGTGVIALGWDIWKWYWDRSHFKMDVRMNMRVTGSPPDPNTYVMVTVSNRSGVTTTLRALWLVDYEHRWRRIIRRAVRSYFVRDIYYSTSMPPLPYVLQPGHEWTGSVIQTTDVETMADRGFLSCQLQHSARKRPMTARVKGLPGG